MSIFRALNRVQESNEALEQAEKDLRERSEQLSNAHRLGKLGDWRILLPGGQIRFGAETYELWVSDPKTFSPTASSVRSVFARDGIERVREAQIEVLKSREARSVDVKIRRGDGTTGTSRSPAKPLTDSAGRVVDCSEHPGHLGAQGCEEQLEAIAYYDPLTDLPIAPCSHATRKRTGPDPPEQQPVRAAVARSRPLQGNQRHPRTRNRR